MRLLIFWALLDEVFDQGLRDPFPEEPKDVRGAEESVRDRIKCRLFADRVICDPASSW